MARQVSHPNVCRVYDIDEVDGHTFLSMEYVDGEDLASLLRRIGRFPEDRALAVARQICAGLAAAHERGVVHRDFKPANVMLDGTGKVRITDFGLAGVAGEAIRAGTPAYMAPEQLAGSEVTVASDVYALGLVLYEIFTGQRALEGKNLAELIHRREMGGVVPPSAIVRELDADVERAIMKCLRLTPSERPSSALAVAALLPGGDPLAAALAAGETPSPEMVAAAGSTDAVSLRGTAAAAGWIALSLLALLLVYDRVMLVNRVPSPKTPEALQDRAVEALARLGYTEPPADTAWGLGFSLDYASYINATASDPDRWQRLARQRPESLYLWYRTSPRPLVPLGFDNHVSGTNPPLALAGMALVVVDASGRLAEFLAVPDPESRAAGSATDWGVVFEAMGLPMQDFRPAPSEWIPPVFADERMAWEGRLPDLEETVRVDAAAYRGRLVSIVLRGPWTRSARVPRQNPPLFNRVLAALEAIIMPALMAAAAVLARRNVKAGRGDRKGAFRTATIIFVTSMAAWLLRGLIGVPGADVSRTFAAIGRALFDAGLMWLTYLGLEPYIRRYSPDSLIGWTRLIAGRWRDPVVARDLMIGVSAGLAMTVFYAVHNLVPPLVGRPEPMPIAMDADLLRGTRHVLGYLLERIGSGVQGAMLCVVGFVALLILLKRPWRAAAGAVIVFTPVAINGMFPPGTPLLDIALGTALIGVFVFTIVRVGLLATMGALTTHFVLLRAPLTTDLSAWRGPIGLWFLGVIALAGFAACYFARVGGAAAERASRRYEPQEV
jgi:serine/threonine-protein kinase